MSYEELTVQCEVDASGFDVSLNASSALLSPRLIRCPELFRRSEITTFACQSQVLVLMYDSGVLQDEKQEPCFPSFNVLWACAVFREKESHVANSAQNVPCQFLGKFPVNSSTFLHREGKKNSLSIIVRSETKTKKVLDVIDDVLICRQLVWMWTCTVHSKTLELTRKREKKLTRQIGLRSREATLNWCENVVWKQFCVSGQKWEKGWILKPSGYFNYIYIYIPMKNFKNLEFGPIDSLGTMIDWDGPRPPPCFGLWTKRRTWTMELHSAHFSLAFFRQRGHWKHQNVQIKA